MSQQQIFAQSFYKNQNPTKPNDYVYDQVYKNASSKNKYSANPKYSYYNALLNMKQKLSQSQNAVYQSIFVESKKPNSSHQTVAPHLKKEILPIYHVEKINRLKFKVYKQDTGSQFIEKGVPVTNLNFQIRIKSQKEPQPITKPRLEQILNEYRKMTMSGRSSHSRAGISNKSDHNNGRVANNALSKYSRSISNQK